MTILKQKASMLRLTVGSMRYEISGEVSQGWQVGAGGWEEVRGKISKLSFFRG